METYRGKLYRGVIRRVLIHSSFCVLNFILFHADQVLPKLPLRHKKVERASPSDYFDDALRCLEIFNEKIGIYGSDRPTSTSR